MFACLSMCKNTVYVYIIYLIYSQGLDLFHDIHVRDAEMSRYLHQGRTYEESSNKTRHIMVSNKYMYVVRASINVLSCSNDVGYLIEESILR